MAEAFFRKQATREIEAGLFRVSSAGLAVEEGRPPVDEVIRLMKEKDIDVSSHLSRQIKREQIAKADLLLTMTLHNSQRLLILDEKQGGKIFTLKEFVLGAEKNNGLLSRESGSRRLEALREWIRREEVIDQIMEVCQDSATHHLRFRFLKNFHQYDQLLSIDDPLGQSERFFRRIAEEIEDYTGRLYALLN